ncbi:putative DD41D transposase [Trichonephila clavipes]|uniref:Putative DD41D transposase n=1 Tax=Trichonephila clavipes TaxID=2585209 RepID=A0A8X6WHB7_TRICX|nr:putative DD41D transposase [Trichonephila clavipes]
MPVGKRFGQHVGQTIHTTTQTSTLSDEIINLAHEIGGDGFNTFSHDDIDELLVDDALSDNDIIDLTLDLTVDGVVGLEGDNDEEEKSTPLTGKLIQEGLQLCSKLENHFLINDPNSERASKLQRELQNCMSGYRELYKKIKESSSQSLITDYIVRKGRATQNENEVCEDPWPLPQISIAETVSSDDGDLEPLRKRCQVIYSQFGLAIHQNDHQARRRFVEWAQNEIAVVPDFHKRILFSDEAHFWLNGYVNKQNCRIWSEANPQVYVETPLHPEKLTVWCALWAGRIIGPYFFKNDEGHNVTDNHDVQELWFQQDGATCHTAHATIDLLKDTFGDRLISRFGPVNWPPRSCDLTPLDYFLWGYVKSLVYADKPQTLDHLEDNIRRVIGDIRPQMLEKVIENWTSRLDYI